MANSYIDHFKYNQFLKIAVDYWINLLLNNLIDKRCDSNTFVKGLIFLNGSVKTYKGHAEVK